MLLLAINEQTCTVSGPLQVDQHKNRSLSIEQSSMGCTDGILVVNKPQGMTSRDVVNRLQRITGIRKSGHAGTLDPLASGVLVVCLGRATRLIRFVQKMRKRYRARFRFGFTSDTDDIDGVVQATEVPRLPEQEDLRHVLSTFLGDIKQTPPQYSAVKIKGRQAYKLAREGKTVELKPRTVSVYRFELLQYRPPEWEAIIECGSGTYVRSLGRDIGQHFGCGAVMSSLNREAIGQFTLEQSATLEELEDNRWRELLLPPRSAVAELIPLQCDMQQAEQIHHGRPLPIDELEHHLSLTDGEEIAILNKQGELIAVGTINLQLRLIKPRIVLG